MLQSKSRLHQNFNEFDTANLETLAFPTLFPDRLGDPNDNVTTCDNSQ